VLLRTAPQFLFRDHPSTRQELPRRVPYDEVAEAKAQGLPYVLAPRVLSLQEWIEQYSGDKGPGEDNPTPP
jgi:hypothetical protein